MQLSVRLLCVSLGSTTLCLVLLVKLFHYNQQGRVATLIRFNLNLEFKFPVPANCVTLLLRCCITVLMRSSGAATSTLTVLVPVDLSRLGMLFIPSVVLMFLVHFIAVVRFQGPLLGFAVALCLTVRPPSCTSASWLHLAP